MKNFIKNLSVVFSIILITLLCFVAWLDSPMTYYNNKGELVQERIEKSTYIGNNKFITDDGNVLEYKSNDRWKINKKYKVYFSDNGTEDYKEDDIIIGVR